MKRLTLLLPLLLLVTACATGFDPNTLSKPSVKSKLVLKEDVHYDIKKMLGVISYTLKAGDYVAEYQNKQGIFYRGPKDSIIENNQISQMVVELDGGIFVPFKMDKNTPRLYSYIEDIYNQLEKDNGILINALIERDMGRIVIHDKLKEPAVIELLESAIANKQEISAGN